MPIVGDDVVDFGWAWLKQILPRNCQTSKVFTEVQIIKFLRDRQISEDSGMVQYYMPSNEPGPAHIYVVQSNYGNAYWTAFADVSRGSSKCYSLVNNLPQPPGSCNTTNKKATGAVIKMDLDDLSSIDTDYISRHEIGHVFGLSHPTYCDPEIMRVTGCTTVTWPNILYNGDDAVTKINGWY